MKRRGKQSPRNRKTCKPGIDPNLQPKGNAMQKMTLAILALVTAVAISGCAPLLIGGGAAVVADEAIEQDRGGDGLF